jgi:hypothetical protein
MKHKLCVIFVSLVLVTLLASSLALVADSKQKWKTFESKDGGFRVKYPSDWKKRETKLPEDWIAASVLELLPPETKPGLHQPRENIASLKVWIENFALENRSGITLEEWINSKVDVYNKMQFRVETVSGTSLDGMPAKKLIYTHDLLRQKSKVMEIYTMKENKGYVLSFGESIEGYDKYINLAEQLLGSFRSI